MLCRRKVKRNNIYVCVDSVPLNAGTVTNLIIGGRFGDIGELLKKHIKDVMKLTKQEQITLVELAMAEFIGMSLQDFGSKEELKNEVFRTFPDLKKELTVIYN